MRKYFGRALLVLASMAAGLAIAQTATRFAAIRVDGTSDLRGAITVTGASSKLTTVASATGGAGFNAPHGAAPTSPANGDIWTTTAGLFARINGATVGPLSSGLTQTLGTFTATWDTGFTTMPTNNWQYTITGNIVTVTSLTLVNGTSNATTFQASTTNGLPSAIRPASTRIIYGFNVTDNGTAAIGCMQLISTGTMTLFKMPAGSANCVAASSFTNTGGKQLRVDGMNTFTYELTP